MIPIELLVAITDTILFLANLGIVLISLIALIGKDEQ